MADLNTLVAERERVKSLLVRVQTFVDDYDASVDINQLILRKPSLESAYKEFDQIQAQIEKLSTTREQKQAINAEWNHFETNYYNILTQIQAFIGHERDRLAVVNNAAANQDVEAKLPDMELPHYSGLHSEWLSFHDNFESLINRRKNLNDCQKFHYLKSCLSGDALKTIESLKISSANYRTAWEILEKTYNHKRLIVQEHICNILNAPQIPKATFSTLKDLLVAVTSNIESLKVLHLPAANWRDIVLVPIITSKLDFATNRDWQATLTKEIPTLEQLTTFLDKKCDLLKSMNETVKINSFKASPNIPRVPQYNKNNGRQIINTRQSLVHVTTSRQVCKYCEDTSHLIYRCVEFNNLSVNSRIQYANKHNLCKNCFRENHETRNCKSKYRCVFCHQLHHSLLHTSSNRENEPAPSTSVVNCTFNKNNVQETNEVLLSTAIVYIKSAQDAFIKCRALLNPGSQSNIITESLANQLKLHLNKNSFPLAGINQQTIISTRSTHATIKSIFNNFSENLSFLVLPKITNNIPNISFSKNINIPSNINLADAGFNKSGNIDLLIGAALFWHILGTGKINLADKGPYLIETKLGWIVGGEFGGSSTTPQCYLLINPSAEDLHEKVSKFWEIEEVEGIKHLSPEEIKCEKYFVNTYSLDIKGRFNVKLPFLNNPPKLGNSRDIALRRLYTLEAKFKHQPNFKEQYSHFMTEYLQLGHMKLVQQYNLNLEGCYLPHHGVFKQSTGKLRVVFDASAKTLNGLSLNDNLMTGPTLQQELFSILARFRTFPIAFCVDIVKMYRQINVNPSDRKFQRILWRFHSTEPVETYELNTVTFGQTCAPFLAVRSMQQTAHDQKYNYPKASAIILRDFYMDDLLSGAKNERVATQLKLELISILAQGGFELSKWYSNCPELITDKSDDALVTWDKDSETKTLGVLWDYKLDLFKFSVKDSGLEYKSVTKRTILSAISQLWDPLGLLSPVIIQAKLILQGLWSLKLSWDEIVPLNLQTSWLQFVNNLKFINRIQIPRRVLSTSSFNIQLHGFCDSSQIAYGAAIYLVCVDSHGNYFSNLLCSKSRVAPIKTVSLPRLELCGALLLARLVDKVVPTLNINICKYFYWTDSAIVLAWLSSTPNTWHTFVANRVAEIQNYSNINDWHHVNSKSNPSDLISRGISSKQLLNNQFWFHGPAWLKQRECDWPESLIETNKSTVLEKRKASNISALIQIPEPSFLTKYSKFGHLQRVTAYLLRFVNNCRKENQKTVGSLSTNEIDKATKFIVKSIQSSVFSEELNKLRKGNYVSRQSRLFYLSPILDKDNLIRVGGRLKNALLPYEQKCPLILPSKHHVTNLIITQEHERQLHAGSQLTLTSIRQKYWIISGRNCVRSIIHKCIKCFRAKPRGITQPMGNLPASRLEPIRPFIKSGTDYIGPIYIKEGGRNSKKRVKAYIALFICFATKAVYLELVSNLTSEAFIAALNRFISRRGHVSDLYSDNATNFKGANKELQTLYKSSVFNRVMVEFLTLKNINWHFIPARSPTFGGLWEANVKSVKFHLKRIIGDASLTFEETYTLLTRIEACLNSRPLCSISNDPNDFNILTPGHFLIGESLTSPVEPNLTEIAMNRLSRWQRLEQLRQHFWNRWSKEYLCSLQQRYKWQNPAHQIQRGSLVVIHEDNVPPQQWLLGRIAELHPGLDNITRVVSVKTKGGILKHAVNKICILPED